MRVEVQNGEIGIARLIAAQDGVGNGVIAAQADEGLAGIDDGAHGLLDGDEGGLDGQGQLQIAGLVKEPGLPQVLAVFGPVITGFAKQRFADAGRGIGGAAQIG